MRITFLGTGAATSYPLAFCGCDICRAARVGGGPDHRRRASAVINSDLLIDLGPDAVSASLDFGVDLLRVSILLQTHAHSDHFDAGHLMTRHPAYGTRDIRELRLVASRATVAAMNQRLAQEEPGADLTRQDWQQALSLRLIPAAHGDRIRLDGYDILCLESLHDPSEESLIYLVCQNGRRLLYATDLGQLSGRALDLLRSERVDMLVLDHTYGVLPAGHRDDAHLDAAGAADLIRRFRQEGVLADDARVFATHLSHEGNTQHARLREQTGMSGYDVAFDGLSVDV